MLNMPSYALFANLEGNGENFVKRNK